MGTTSGRESATENKSVKADAKWGLNTHICIFFAIMHIVGVVGAFYVPLTRKTFWFSFFYYYFTGFGITAGHHRLWSHRAYNASTTLEVILMLAASGAVQGSIKWWCQEHRAHHRYTDTEKDPYNATEGFFWCHIGWILSRPPPGMKRSGWVDIEDLKKNKVVVWQDRLYVPAFFLMCYVVPTVVAWKLWGDAWGGFIYASVIRWCIVQNSSMCVNSVAHFFGETPFDDKHTPRDHFITALITGGEGYHNFHHQFPNDYRNAIRWYQFDPTKWFIWTMAQIGLASHLKVFPDNEIRKGQLTMELKKLRQVQDNLRWPIDSQELPVISWES